MKIKFICCMFLVSITVSLQAQDTSLYQRLNFIKGEVSMPYRLLLPENYSASKKYPLIIFLHGSGERGNDNEAQLSHGADLFLRGSVRKKYPAIVVFPQCAENSYWSNVNIKRDKTGREVFTFQTGGKPTVAMDLLQQLLKQLIKNYPVQKKQIYVGGLSMGGMGTFEIVNRNPNLFAAAFPMCGGADVAAAPKFKNTHWWIFHGAKDDTVSPQFDERIVPVLKQLNTDVTFSLYPEANHNCWDSAFAEPMLLAWLFSKSK